MTGRPHAQQRHHPRAFTIVEIIFSILVIAILLSIVLVGIRAASRGAQGSSDRQSVLAIKIAVDSFKQEFGFLPPLVKGADPSLTGASNQAFNPSTDRVNIFSTGDQADLNYLRGRSGPNPGDAINWSRAAYRFSHQSLPYYLNGVLDQDADGVEGPGMRAPRRDGSFAPSGATYPASVDVSRRNLQLWQSSDPGQEFVYEFRDRNGVPIRYYRWERESTLSSGSGALRRLNVPDILGNPDNDGNATRSPADEELKYRDAAYAIVAAGPNRAFGDITTGGNDFGTEDAEEVRRTIGATGGLTPKAIERDARSDNVVEVGN